MKVLCSSKHGLDLYTEHLRILYMFLQMRFRLRETSYMLFQHRMIQETLDGLPRFGGDSCEDGEVAE